MATAEQAGAWLRALEQMQAGLMPPLGEDRPDAMQRARAIYWIERTALASGHAEAYRRKTQLPAYGNLVDHNLLFSGAIGELPFTPARIWRRSPYIFSGSVKGVGKAKVQNRDVFERLLSTSEMVVKHSGAASDGPEMARQKH